jgi:Family of unknown function (DUF6221)
VLADDLREGAGVRIDEFLMACFAEDEEWAASLMGREVLWPEDQRYLLAEWNKRTRSLCDMKRQIVQRHHQRGEALSCAECGGYTATTTDAQGVVHHGYVIPWPCPTLRLLAVPYADRPGYDPTWRP